jgi:hypothetical protein
MNQYFGGLVTANVQLIEDQITSRQPVIRCAATGLSNMNTRVGIARLRPTPDAGKLTD